MKLGHFAKTDLNQSTLHTDIPKLKNYLDYTFVRLVNLEQDDPGKYFLYSDKQDWVCFNTGLQTQHGSDIIATFQRYIPKVGGPTIGAYPCSLTARLN